MFVLLFPASVAKTFTRFVNELFFSLPVSVGRLTHFRWLRRSQPTRFSGRVTWAVETGLTLNALKGPPRCPSPLTLPAKTLHSLRPPTTRRFRQMSPRGLLGGRPSAIGRCSQRLSVRLPPFANAYRTGAYAKLESLSIMCSRLVCNRMLQWRIVSRGSAGHQRNPGGQAEFYIRLRNIGSDR